MTPSITSPFIATTLPAAPGTVTFRPPSLTTGLNAEMLLNRVALQLDQARYLHAVGQHDRSEIESIVRLLKQACGLAFPTLDVWGWLCRQPVAAAGNAHHLSSGAAGRPLGFPHQLEARTEAIDQVSVLLDRSAEQLARMSGH